MRLSLSDSVSNLLLIVIFAVMTPLHNTASTTVGTTQVQTSTVATTKPPLEAVHNISADPAKATVSSVYLTWFSRSAYPTGVKYCVNCPLASENCDVSSTEYNCTGLNSGNSYNFTVFATATGYPNSSAAIASGQTLVSPVTSVSVTGSNETCLDVSWAMSNTSGVSYQLTCGSNSPIHVSTSLSGSCCNLQSGESHNVFIVVKKGGFNDSVAGTAIGKTLVSPVTSVSVTGSNETCLDVSWTMSNTSGVSYELTCGSNSTINAATSLSGSCCNLQSGESHNVSIVVKKGGFNDSVATMSTGKTHLSPVSNSSIIWRSTFESVSVNWSPSASQNVFYNVTIGHVSLNTTATHLNQTGFNPGTVLAITIVVAKFGFSNSVPATSTALTKPRLIASSSSFTTAFKLDATNAANSELTVSWNSSFAIGADSLIIDLKSARLNVYRNVPFSNYSIVFRGSFSYSDNATISAVAVAEKASLVQNSSDSYSAIQYTDPSVPTQSWADIQSRQLIVLLNATSLSQGLTARLFNSSGVFLSEQNCSFWAQSCSFNFAGLTPYTNYSLQYLARYFDRVSITAPAVWQSTLQDKPSQPTGASIISNGAEWLQISWSPPEQPNGQIIAYTVRCYSSMGLNSTVNATSTNQNVTNLSAGVLYSCDVSAWTTIGEGLRSVETSPPKLLDDLPPEQSLTPRFAARRGRGVVLNWNTVEFSKGYIFEYALRLDSLDSVGNVGNCTYAARFICIDCSRVHSPDRTAAILTGCSDVANISYSKSSTELSRDTGDVLQPNTRYRVSVWPVNRAGPGLVKSNATSRTLELPSGPVSLVGLQPDKRQMRLNFSRPTAPNGRIMAYAVRLANSSGSCLSGYYLNLNLSCELDLPDACNVSATVDQFLADCLGRNSLEFNAALDIVLNLTGLVPWANYSVSVTPVSQTLAGNSISLTERTLPDTPDAPGSLVVHQIEDTYAILRWVPPATLNGEFKRYWLHVFFSRTTDQWITISSYSTNEYRVSNLTQCVSNYEFTLFTENNYSNSSTSGANGATKIGNLTSSIVSPNVNTTVLNSSSISLTWLPVTHGICLVNYTVNQNYSGIYNVVSPTYLAQYLQPFTWYSFSVQATVSFNGISTSAIVASEVVSRTSPDKADPPQNLSCVTLPDVYNRVRCSWVEPLRRNGVPIRYVLRLTSAPPGVSVSESLPFNASKLELDISSVAYIKPDISLTFAALLVNTPESPNPGLEVQSNIVVIKPGKAFRVLGVDLQDTANVQLVGHDKATISLDGFSRAFNDSFGVIRYCSLLVGRDIFSDADWTLGGNRNYDGSDRGYKHPYTFNVSCSLRTAAASPTSSLFSSLSMRFSAASSDPMSTFVIGDASDACIGHCNGPLAYEQPYRVYLVACTTNGCTMSDGDIRFTTGFNYTLRQIIGGVIGAVLFALLIVILVILAIKRRDELGRCMKRPHRDRNGDFSDTNRPWWYENGFGTEIPHSVAIANFRRYVSYMLRDSELEVHRQFEEIREAAVAREHNQFTFNAAMADCNRTKNRYTDILPYDHTRVMLESSYEGPGHAPDDYINASYVKGLDREREFIASQGPLPGTVDDHWRMIYEHRVALIVTLTQCQEGLKKKSEPYWPSEVGQSEIYDEIRVVLESESSVGTYTVRKLLVTCSTDRNQTEPLQVVQLYYTGWADFSVPNVDDLADFLANMRRYAPQRKRDDSEPPILVHCSAGVGRTGTLIALDILVRSLEQRRASSIDVFETVMELRYCRKLMVQTKGQLAFIYRFMLSYLDRNGYLPPIDGPYADPRDIEMSAVYATPRQSQAGASNPGFQADEAA